MDHLQYWANVATILGTVLVIPVSAGSIWWQLWRQTRLARLANAQSLVELSSPFNLRLIESKRFADYWVRGAQEYENYDEVGRYRYKSLLIWWLILQENIFLQYKNRLLDKSIYKAWESDLRDFLQNQCPKDRWLEVRKNLQQEFCKHVDCIFAELGSPATSATGAPEKR